MSKTIFMNFFEAANSGQVELYGIKPSSLNIPSFEFPPLDTILPDDNYELLELYKCGDTYRRESMPSRYALTTRHKEWGLEIVYVVYDDIVKYWMKPYIVHKNIMSLETQASIAAADMTISKYRCEVTNILCGMLATRTCDYLESDDDKDSKINRLRKMGGKPPIHTPKIIRLHDVRTIGGRHSEKGTGRKLSHSVEVQPMLRHYKSPIKRGRNAGKTVIQVRGHVRGEGLPPKPKTAEYMQHRVVA